MKIKNIILDIFICLFLGLFIFSSYKIFAFQMEMRKLDLEQKEVEQVIEKVAQVEEKKPRFSPETYDNLKKINEDYVGYLEFDSGLISLPIVQTADNDYYLNHSFKKKNSTQGAAFVDCRNLLSDTNITIYGHYVYADTSKMFSPLTKLKKKENYEKHNLLRLHLRDETRTYQIAYVYEYDYTTTDYDYTVRNFGTETKFYNFFKYPRQQRYYDTQVEMEYGDRILTLQTCVRNQEDKRLIVVAKEIEEKK